MPTEAAAFYRNPSGDVVADATNGMIYSAAAYNRICEYLHKQLIRKGRASKQVFIDTQKWGRVYYCYDIYEKDGHFYVNGYRLDTGGVQPYNYDGVNNLGLSQFFNKQKPTAAYSGPSEGQITDYFWIKKTKFSNFRIVCIYKGGWRKEFNDLFYEGEYPPIRELITRCGVSNYQIVNEHYDEKKNGGGEFIDLDDGVCYFYRVSYRRAGEGGEHEKVIKEVGCAAYPLFHADSNSPVMGSRRWAKRWGTLYKLDYDTKSKGKFGKWTPLFKIAVVVVTFVLTYVAIITYGPMASAALSAIAGGGAVSLAGVMATLAVAGAVGGFLATVGSLSGNKKLTKFGRVTSFIGAIGSIYLSIKSLFFQSVAAQNASTATNQALAGAAGANQTAGLYNGVSVSSWAGTGAGAGAASSASVGGLAAAGATSTSQLYLTAALKVAGVGYKSFALIQDVRSEFRKHDDTQDTDMQEQSDDEKVVSVNSDARQDTEGDVTRKFYERDVEYDVGLIGGTLISIDDSAMDEPNSAIKNLPTQ